MAKFKLKLLPQHGWRRTGVYNILLACTCCLVLLVSLSVSLSKQKEHGGFGTTEVYRGRCKDTARLNTILHLVLNIISTGILSSSNFFMQIVTSPSRPDIDRAHAYLRSVDIGVQSLRNAWSLSNFKKTCWLFLVLSSVPIHLFFNSAIYEIKYQGRSFNLAIAAESFINGRNYWLPGASLSPSGSSSPVQVKHYIESNFVYFNKTATASAFLDRGYINPPILPNSTTNEILGEIEGYGDYIRLEDYWNASSSLQKTVAETARSGSRWDTLDAERCMAEYRSSQLRTEYGNLIIIVDTGLPETKGWRRVDVYDFNSSNLSAKWDTYVPPLDINSLWSWNMCSIREFSDIELRRQTREHTCGRIFGLGAPVPNWDKLPQDNKLISFREDGMNGATQSNETARGYSAKMRTLKIRHCKAEQVTKCQVRLSNVLLLVVITCVLVKVATCIILVRNLKNTPLVTPGDAIESFISTPDSVTRGLATMSINDVQVLDYSPRQRYEKVEHAISFIKPASPSQSGPTRLVSVVPRATWVQVYYPAFIALSVLLVAVVFSNLQLSPREFGASTNTSGILDIFGEDLNYMQVLLITNIPQIFLSLCYIAINTLFTQLQVEKEWNSYAQSYKPLRVSYPVGDQISTYRLQLPYKYSVPLIAASALMHWLIANSIFLMVIEGDPSIRRTLEGLYSYLGVSEDATVAIGYSSLSTLVTFIGGCALVLSPLFFRLGRLQNTMVLGGTNSLVMSAACHVPVPLQHFPSVSGTTDYLKKVAQGRLCWGAMALPHDLAQRTEGVEVAGGGGPIMHLGFAGPDQVVGEPKNGRFYL